jgi:hypothetical protein
MNLEKAKFLRMGMCCQITIRDFCSRKQVWSLGVISVAKCYKICNYLKISVDS